MPGSVGKNLRKGDIAEDLGRLLLRPFCAVAPVFGKDDFGIDTIATLLEDDPTNHLRLLAKNTFGVQFKSASIREIGFIEDFQIKWIQNLQFPYYIGSVDLSNASLSLYCLNALSRINGDFDEEFYLHLDQPNNDGKLRLFLEEPILSIKANDISDNNFRINLEFIKEKKKYVEKAYRI